MKRFLSIAVAIVLLFTVNVPVQADSEVPDIEAKAGAEGISKYGNVVLDVSSRDFLAAGYNYGDIVRITFLEENLEIPFVSNYTEVDSGMAALVGKSVEENLLLSINMGNFAETYRIAKKETLEDDSAVWSYYPGVDGPVMFVISMKTPGGYYEEYTLRHLSYTIERGDYSHLSDEEFANFRPVNTSGIGKNRLYRSATPVDPKYNRNTYADLAFKRAGVTVVMNLSDNNDTVVSFPGYEDSYYASTKYIALQMGVDFSGEDFRGKLADGLRFFIENKGVYGIHCLEGKDRTGFVVAVLESLMGATADEIISDYMVTYYNYYGVTENDSRYSVISNSNIVSNLQKAFGISNLAEADLVQEATEYLREIGLSDEEIMRLKTNLQPETTYVVKPGDSLWKISERFLQKGSRYSEIANANRIKDPSFIRVGQVIVIPAA